MRVIPVPESALAKYPDGVRRVIAAPDGDLLNEECRPADMLINTVEFMGHECAWFHAFYQLEAEDIDKLRENGGIIELSLMSMVVPFSIYPL